jgi:hypothetical protein
MDLQVYLEYVPVRGARKNLASMKLFVSRGGLATLLIVLLLWWRGLSYEKALWRSWFGSNGDGGPIMVWAWNEVSYFPSTSSSLVEASHLLAERKIDIKQIKPSEDLTWHPCYDQYDCARLEVGADESPALDGMFAEMLQVPLDWLNPAPSPLATIAIIRYNATDRSNYKGPIFINPGGPGGSGIWFVKHLAPYYQSVVGKNHVSLPLPLVPSWWARH